MSLPDSISRQNRLFAQKKCLLCCHRHTTVIAGPTCQIAHLLAPHDRAFSLDRGTLSKPIVSLRSLQQDCLCVGLGGGKERVWVHARLSMWLLPQQNTPRLRGWIVCRTALLYFGREKERERTRFIEEGTRAPMDARRVRRTQPPLASHSLARRSRPGNGRNGRNGSSGTPKGRGMRWPLSARYCTDSARVSRQSRGR